MTPKIPDFDRIARELIQRWGLDDPTSPAHRPQMLDDIAAQLRQVWNARGVVDREALPLLETMLRGIDR